MDYIVERKGVADLLGSIKSGRYEQQKYWMKRCGLRHLMYLVEGKPEDLAEGGLGVFRWKSPHAAGTIPERFLFSACC